MFFKEENILIPMLNDLLTEDEWLAIARESAEVGYCLVEPNGPWQPVRHPLNAEGHLQALKAQESGTAAVPGDGLVHFDTGVLRLDQLSALLDLLPIDITFVDENDIVRYFSRAEDRVFPRPKTVIGRHINNCHPPASVHVVEKLQIRRQKLGRFLDQNGRTFHLDPVLRRTWPKWPIPRDT
jgi:DUF438 domain-containing protein